MFKVFMLVQIRRDMIVLFALSWVFYNEAMHALRVSRGGD